MSHFKKILVIDKMHPSINDVLEAIGYDCDYQPDITRAEIILKLSAYTGMIVRSKTFIDEALLLNADKLKFVCRAGAGIDNVDMEVLSRKNILLLNAPEGNRDALGEHTLGMLLMLMNKLNLADHEVRNLIWDRESNRGHEIKGKTVGIYGFGFMGSAVAEKLQGFYCELIAYYKYKTNYAPQYVTEVELETFQKKAQIVSLHIPLTWETQSLFDYAYLSKFKRIQYVLNMARGEILPLIDLYRLLIEGKIKGAALDVLENEKFKTFLVEEHKIYQALFGLKQVVFSPHVAGWTDESYERINIILAKKISQANF